MEIDAVRKLKLHNMYGAVLTWRSVLEQAGGG